MARRKQPSWAVAAPGADLSISQRAEWRNRINGALDFLEKLKNLKASSDPKWHVGIRGHYRSVAIKLLEEQPGLLPSEVKAYHDRLTHALDE